MSPSIPRLIERFKTISERQEQKFMLSIRQTLQNYTQLENKHLQDIEILLNGFKSVYSSYYEKTLATVEKVLMGFAKTKQELLQKQRTTAEDINILNILGFTYDELKHSKFIAWLLDSEETHAQNNLFFRLFLKALSLPQEYADVQYKARTEVVGKESRIDIEIASVETGVRAFVIHIENKVGSAVEAEQINREKRDLNTLTKRSQVLPERTHGFVLSMEQPDFSITNCGFTHISWNKMAFIVADFIKEAQAERARWTAQQYLECIEKNICTQIEIIRDNKEAEDV